MPNPRCQSYAPGHHIHWIQGKLAFAEDGPRLPVHLVQRIGTRVDVVIDDQLESWYFHDDPTTLRRLAAWTPQTVAELLPHGLLALDGSGCLYPCRDLADWVDCPTSAWSEPDDGESQEPGVLHPALETLLRLIGIDERPSGEKVAQVCHCDRELILQLVGEAVAHEVDWLTAGEQARLNGALEERTTCERERHAWERVADLLRLGLVYLVWKFS